ncbi:olfactory receptor 846 [Mus musculus]|jgi:olfactory receptor|uniref:Olfactory receptor n=1 Tax=Mus musculus TaxID=10090 RepID=Q8VET8_MOUSE|nr:olfactory receptor 846 [Mus musculus]AAI34376.1 Olfactory receptor 846 [Mus musculus]AAL61474.1 olfactory receptor MOR149-3 [Mus musculus]AAP71327.1 olfactory receptor Olfr846 [Mus musculus]EDL25066.1 mCG66464 [Mus musculus]|eukprot:NP_666394.1 olfactory receptor 846 [Mus musculus]
MEPGNQTGAYYFYLTELTSDPTMELLIFSLFLFIYLVTILGNLLIIIAVSSDSHLQTPMYHFLSKLSFADICLSTTTIPNMLKNIHTQDQSISYTGCLIQACFVLNFALVESCILAAMAYDRYAAICHPLNYTVIMNPHFCDLLILLSLIISIVNSLLQCLMILRLSFCTNNELPLFFCELAQVIKLACSDTLINYILIYLATFIFGGIPIFGIIFSYTRIVSSILKISSLRGKYKAFSTCGSHLSVVSLFYGAGVGVYISSSIAVFPQTTTVSYIMYTVLPQMLNPFIYSLRNKDMKEALRKLIAKESRLP